jgi:hypothetical protein
MIPESPKPIRRICPQVLQPPPHDIAPRIAGHLKFVAGIAGSQPAARCNATRASDISEYD